MLFVIDVKVKGPGQFEIKRIKKGQANTNQKKTYVAILRQAK